MNLLSMNTMCDVTDCAILGNIVFNFLVRNRGDGSFVYYGQIMDAMFFLFIVARVRAYVLVFFEWQGFP